MTHPNGQSLKAQVAVQAREEAIVIRRSAVDLVDLDLESRRAETATGVASSVPLGSATRVHLEGTKEADNLYWMSPEDQGVVLGLDDSSADLLAERWTVDEEGVLVDRTSFSGITSHLALIGDGLGGNRFFWIDAVFGVGEEDLLRHEGRLVPPPDFRALRGLLLR